MAQSTAGIATRSRTPTKLGIITAISFLVMAALPLVVGSFQISLLSKLLLSGWLCHGILSQAQSGCGE